MIYQLEADFEAFYSFDFDVEDLLEKMPGYSQRFRAKPRLSGWIEPQGRFYKGTGFTGNVECIPDISIWALGNLVLNERAYDILSDHINGAGEFLPVRVDDKQYYMFNTLHILSSQAVDLTGAIEVVDSGVHFGASGLKVIEDDLNDVDVFKMKEEKLIHSFVTDGFKKLCKDAGLTGLSFLSLNGV
ncbi:MAG: hypothetical protein CSH37_14915 [Thalassolituus sp.]|jgi:hypothetical protein|nr:MAG: hypothetical protein CSH37_14915 [Thalassolituus sp.]